jgi:hypothetical protein
MGKQKVGTNKAIGTKSVKTNSLRNYAMQKMLKRTARVAKDSEIFAKNRQRKTQNS